MLSLSRRRKRSEAKAGAVAPRPAHTDVAAGCTPIGDVSWREPVVVQGRVRSIRVQPWAEVATLECTLVDETGGITVVFLGRRKIAGVQPGTVMRVEGVAGAHHGKLAMLNPEYTLIEH